MVVSIKDIADLWVFQIIFEIYHNFEKKKLVIR